MLFAKEHYRLMEQFEADYNFKKLAREDKSFWARGAIYCDGHINDLFRAYRHGYSFGKAATQLEVQS